MKFFKKIPPKVWCFCACLLLVAALSLTNIFYSFDLFFYDLYFKLRPGKEVFKDIAIIEIDDQTLNKLSTWPLPRDFHASLLKVLREAGAEAVVFDIIFSEPTFLDQDFAKAIAKNKVFLPVVFELNKHPRNNNVAVSNKKIADVKEDFKNSAAGIGHINVFVSPDGKIRKVPLFVKYKKKLYPHLALSAASKRLGLNLEKVSFKNGKVVAGRLAIPVSENNAFFVNYPNQWGKAFPHFSYLQLLKSYANLKKGKPALIDLKKLKGKTCFVGLTAAGATDLKPTPLEESYPMLGLQASVYNSLVNKSFIQEASSFLNLAIAIFIFILTFLIVIKLPPVKSLFLNSGFALLFFAAAFSLFAFAQIWIDTFLPLKIIALVYIGGVIVKFLDEKKNKEILEKELDIARKIQESFLPKNAEALPGLDLACYMKPAKFVAGDLYDAIKLDKNRIGIFLADVSGKGTSAALIMAQTISIFRILAKESQEPGELLSRLNKELSKTLSGKFITAIYIIFDLGKKEIILSSAGHMPPLVYNQRKKEAKEIEFEAGIPLGVMGSAVYASETKKIGKEEKIVAYTDGITEARNRKGEEFEIGGLKNFLSQYGSLNNKELKQELIEKLSEFTKKMPQADDITFIISKFST